MGTVDGGGFEDAAMWERSDRQHRPERVPNHPKVLNIKSKKRKMLIIISEKVKRILAGS